MKDLSGPLPKIPPLFSVSSSRKETIIVSIAVS
jgi:hypothetical protein